jgi:RNA polymerase sigma-70 factor (family 1)
LLRVRDGDQNAFAVLFSHYKDRIYSIAYRLTTSRETAEEIVQDVFLKIWLRRNELGNIDHFEAYLHTIARRATYRALKQMARQKQQTQNVINDEDIASSHISSEQILQLKQYDGLLKEAIDRLPPKQKETFQLIRQQGYKRSEVAEQLNVSPETVKYNLDEGLRKIRAYFMAHTDYLPLVIVFMLRD